ncbi:MAG: ABC transporter permease [Actinobacteria bacterium]|nr:ABC transporter permease [Actinomycetota bacterium]
MAGIRVKISRMAAMVGKDLGQVFRNRFMAVISVLLILLYALLYNLMPKQVEETFKLGLYLEGGDRAVAEGEVETSGMGTGTGFPAPDAVEAAKEGEDLIASPENPGPPGGKAVSAPGVPGTAEPAPEEGTAGLGRGVELVEVRSLEELRGLVEREEVAAGLLLDLGAQPPRLELYVTSRAPEETAEAGEVLSREIAYSLLGHRLPVDFHAVVLGPDMAGRQIPLRDRLRVLILAFVFLLELYALGNLLVEEIQRRTAQAVLVTPVSHGEFIAAKALTGMVVAFGEGLLLALLLRALVASTWLAVLVFLVLGASLVVGFSFILGAVSRDFMSMAMISLVPFLLLMLPAFVLLYPGFTSPLLKAVPTYYLVEPLNGILNYGKGLSDYPFSIFALCLFSLFFFWLGWYILRRRLT